MLSLSTDGAESVVVLGLVNSCLRCSCVVHPQPLSNTTSEGISLRNPSTRRTFLRVQRHVKALKLCERELALPTKKAKQQPRQPRCRKSSARDVMRSETIASRRMLGLKTCVTSEEFVRHVRDEWRESKGLSETHPQDIAPVKELWTLQALAMKGRKTVSALDISQVRGKHEATLKGTSKDKLSPDFTRKYSSPAISSRMIAHHKPRQPVWTETSDNWYKYRNELHEEIGKYCERTVGAIKMNSIYKANLLLRISIFFKDLASVDVDHIKIVYMKACCGNARAGPILMRINFCECILMAVASLGTSEVMLKNRPRSAFRSVAMCRSG